MNKFCSNCGCQLHGENFCPNCGASAAQPSSVNNIQQKKKLNTESSHRTLMDNYYILLAFPVVYIITLLCKWFKISIPYFGEFSYNIYDLWKGYKRLSEYIDVQDLGAIPNILLIVFIGLAIYIFCKSIYTVIKALNNDYNTASRVKTISTTAIIEGAIAILSVIVIKSIIESEIDNSVGMGGSPISNILNFTAAPVIMIISGVIGAIAAGKSESDTDTDEPFDGDSALLSDDENDDEYGDDELSEAERFLANEALENHYKQLDNNSLLEILTLSKYTKPVTAVVRNILEDRGVDIEEWADRKYNDLLQDYGTKTDDELKEISSKDVNKLKKKAAEEVLSMRYYLECWVCVHCGATNDASIEVCQKCGSPKDED